MLTQNNWKIESDTFLFFYPGCTPTLVLWLLPIPGPYALWHWDRLHPPPTLIRVSGRRWIILGSFVRVSNLSISSSHKPSLWSSHWLWCHYSFATAAWGNTVFSAVSQKLSIIWKCLLTRQWNVFTLANHVTKTSWNQNDTKSWCVPVTVTSLLSNEYKTGFKLHVLINLNKLSEVKAH